MVRAATGIGRFGFAGSFTLVLCMVSAAPIEARGLPRSASYGEDREPCAISRRPGDDRGTAAGIPHMDAPVRSTTCFLARAQYLALTLQSVDSTQASYEATKTLLEQAAALRK